MRSAHFAWLAAGLVTACTQDFAAYEPTDGSTGPDASAPIDAAGPKDATTARDATSDAPPDVTVKDAAPDVIVADAGCTGLTYGGHCYELISNALDFDTAKNACAGAGGHLAVLNSGAEQAAVQVLGAGTQRWIGLYRAGGPPNDGSFSWIDGKPRAGYANWGAGYPQGGGQCAYLLDGGTWANDSCSNAHAAICERP